jgi:small subunit ribosomal protein S18
MIDTVQNQTSNEELSRVADRDSKKVFFRRRKGCPLDSENIEFSYKDPAGLKRFVSDGGRILPRRITSLCATHQRKLKREVKRSRILALMPF